MSVSGSGQSKLVQELQAVLADGPSFQKRLEQLISERVAIESARADLHIAMQAKDAYDEAARMRDSAAAVLAAAQKNADNLRATALDDADRTRKEAQEIYDRLTVEARQTLDDARAKTGAMIAEAESKASRITADLNAAQGAIQSKLIEATRMSKEADEKLRDIATREAAAEAAESAAKEKVRRIMAAIGG